MPATTTAVVGKLVGDAGYYVGGPMDVCEDLQEEDPDLCFHLSFPQLLHGSVAVKCGAKHTKGVVKVSARIEHTV